MNDTTKAILNKIMTDIMQELIELYKELDRNDSNDAHAKDKIQNAINTKTEQLTNIEIFKNIWLKKGE